MNLLNYTSYLIYASGNTKNLPYIVSGILFLRGGKKALAP